MNKYAVTIVAVYFLFGWFLPAALPSAYLGYLERVKECHKIMLVLGVIGGIVALLALW